MKPSKFARSTYWLYKYQVNHLPQTFKKLFVLDFEATCEANLLLTPQEIIEFPCLVVNPESFDVEDKFHQFVKPKVHPISKFCSELTGITPTAVENEPEFPEVFDRFTNWLKIQQQTVEPEETIFITCGNWDLKAMLPKQCHMYNLEVPETMRRWINLKTIFYQTTGYFPRGLVDMHKYLHLTMIGKLHSGIDDCQSIVRILKQLRNKGLSLIETDSL